MSNRKKTPEAPALSSADLENPQYDFPIVAIGASAGGLEALEAFFTNMPPDSGMAFVVITHLDPTHKTLMPELLTKYTTMSVEVAEEGMPVTPNTVYMIPVNVYMSIHEGKLHLEEPLQPRGHRQPVDHFFQSLADDQAENAYCVILSGTGTDGTLGIKAVKEAGGMTVVQDVNSARYSGMPYSAIQTGVVDVVLPVEQIPAQLMEFMSLPSVVRGRREPHASIAENLGQICQALESKTGADFASYKSSTLIRRIERRMIVSKKKSVGEYVRMLRQNPEESKALFRDLLIGVTSFFRDSEAFDLLREKVLPELVKNRDKEEPIRIWTAGCASGEETYSLAILVAEEMERQRVRHPVQIFGTDMAADAIIRARAGTYSASIKAEVPEKYLEKYFRKENGGYRVVSEIREMIVFAPHNLLREPPFSNLDLVSCRNLLIYLEPKIQSRLIPLFHHSLRPGGYLFLGPSETTGGCKDQFETIDKRWKIFRWKPSNTRLPQVFPFVFDQSGASAERSVVQGAVKTERPNPASIGQGVLLRRYTPPSVIINERQEILYVFSRISPYLEPPLGDHTSNIIKMAGKELRPVLRAAIHQAFSEGKNCTFEQVRLEVDGTPRFINLVVEPVKEPPSARGMAVVSFEPVTAQEQGGEGISFKESDIVRNLEDQLRVTTEQLQATMEESGQGEEELKSANEELMSMNEELQSANEELETSKEELQALNEELTTVNSELQSKLDELSQSNNDMQNLMLSSQVPTIFLDKGLHIKRYTPQVSEIFNLIEGDIGRPIRHISSNINYPELEGDAKKVLRDLKPIEREIHCAHKGDFVLRVLPYRTTNDVIEGVVLTFIDITRRKGVEKERSRLATIVESSQDAIIGKELDGKITSWNHGAQEIYGYSPEEMVGKNIEILVPQDRREELEEIYRKLRAGDRCKGLQTVRRRKDGTQIHVSLTISPIFDEDGEPVAASVIARDITGRMRAEEALRDNERRLRLALQAGGMGTFEWDVASGTVEWSVGHYRLLGYEPDEVEPTYDLWRTSVHPEDLERVETEICRARDAKDEYSCEYRVVWRNGSVHWVEARGYFLYEEDGKPRCMTGVMIDIEDRKEKEQALADARDAAESANMTKSQFLANMSHEIRTPITIMQGSYELLEGEVSSEHNQRVLQMAREASAALLRLVDDILDFSKMEAGTIRVVNEPFELRPCIEKAVRAFGYRVEQKGLNVAVEIPDEVPDLVVADSGRFHQVLTNLLGNSVKFTKEGEIRIAVKIEEGPADNKPTLVVSVTDTGIGIPEENQANIFDNFTQADGSHSRQYGGAGLGLAISKGLVELMGGAIEVESTEGQGSTFRFRIPVTAGESVQSPQDPSNEKPPEKVSGKSARILLAEDDPHVAELLRTILEKEGWEVVVAENGKACLELFEPGRFDLILMDIQMPVMDGYEATRAIREKEDAKSPITIIALTAHALQTVQNEVTKNGMNSLLTKPVSRDQLIKTVGYALK